LSPSGAILLGAYRAALATVATGAAPAEARRALAWALAANDRSHAPPV